MTDIDMRINISAKEAQANLALLEKRVGSLEQDTKRYGETAKKANEKASRSSRLVKKSVDGVSNSFKEAAKRATAFASVIGVGAGIGFAIKQAAQFESGLVGVAKTTGLAGAELNKLASEIDALSRAIPVSSAQLLELGQAAGQLGVSGSDNILKFAETIAKLNVATDDLQGSEAAQTLARILNVTGESISTVDTLASVIVSLGNNMATTEGQIARVTNEIARSTSEFDISSAEIASIAAAMSSMGVQAEIAGTSVGGAFRRIQEAITLGGAELENFAGALNLNADELANAFSTDKVAGLELFLRAIKELGAERAGIVLDEIGLGGERFAKALVPLAANVEAFVEAQRLSNAEVANATALNNEAEVAYGTFNNEVSRLGNNVSSLAKSFGDLALDGLTAEVSGIANSLKEFQDEGDAAQRILDNVTEALDGFAFAAAAAGVAVAIGPIVAATSGAFYSLAGALIFGGGTMIATSVKAKVLNSALLGTAAAATKAQIAFSVFGGAVAGFSFGEFLAETDIARIASLNLANTLVKLGAGFEMIVAKAQAYKNTVGGLTGDLDGELERIEQAYESTIRSADEATEAALAEEFAYKDLRKAVADTNAEIDANTQQIEKNAAAAEAAAEADAALAAQKKATEQAGRKLNETEQDLLDTLFPLAKIERERKAALSVLAKAKKEAKKGTYDWAEAEKRLNAQFDDLIPNIQLGNEEIAIWNGLTTAGAQATQALLDKVLPTVQATAEYNEELRLLNEFFEANPDKVHLAAEAQENLKRSYKELFPEFEAQEKAAEDLAKSWEEATNRIDEAFADAWKGAFDSFEDFSDSIKDAFKNLLAELAHQAITRPILVQLGLSGGLGGGVAGGLLGSTVGAAASSLLGPITGGLLAGGGGGIGSSVSGLFSGGISQVPGNLMGGVRNFGAGFGQAFGFGGGGGLDQAMIVMPDGSTMPGSAYFGQTSPGGGMTGFNLGSAAANLFAGAAGGFAGQKLGTALTGKTPNSSVGATGGALLGAKIGSTVPVIGTLIGAAIGGILDSLFGSKQKDPRFTIGPGRTAAELGGARQVFEREDIVSTTESAFGAIRLSTDKDLAADFTEQQAQAVFDFFNAITEIENAIADSVSPETTARIKDAVLMQAELYEKNSFDFQKFVGGRFDIIFDEIGGSIDQAFDRLTEGLSGEEMLASIDQLVAGAFIVGEAQGDLKTYFDSLQDVTMQVERTIEGFDYLGNELGIELPAGLSTMTTTVSGLTLESIKAGQELLVVNQVMEQLGGELLSLDKAGSDAAQALIEAQGGLESFIDVVGNLNQNLVNISGELFGSLEERVAQINRELDAQNDSARELYDQEMQRYEDSLAASESLADSINELFLIGASPQEAFEFQQARFESLLTAAQGGDVEAASELADFAPEFLEAAQNFFASGDQFQAIKDAVIADVTALSATLGGAEAPSAFTPATDPRLDELYRRIDERDAAFIAALEQTFVDQINELSEATGIPVADLLAGLGVLPSDIVNKITEGVDFGSIGTAVSDLLASGSPLLELLTTTKSLVDQIPGLFALLSGGDEEITSDDLTGLGLDADKIITDADLNADGIIDANEGLQAFLDPESALWGELNAVNTNTNNLGTIEEVLRDIDTNTDGVLTLEELKQAGLEDLAAQKLLDNLDVDGSGTISALELIQGVLGQVDSEEDTGLTVEDLKQAGLEDAAAQKLLDNLDVDGDGTISQLELLNGLLAGIDFQPEIEGGLSVEDLTQAGLEDAAAQKLLENLDVDGSGTISQLELLYGLLQNIDADTDGLLTIGELKEAGLEETAAAKIINELDVDGSGTVSAIEVMQGILNGHGDILRAILAKETVVNIDNSTTVINPEPTTTPDLTGVDAPPEVTNGGAQISSTQQALIDNYNTSNGTNFTTLAQVQDDIVRRAGEGAFGNINVTPNMPAVFDNGGIVSSPMMGLLSMNSKPEAVIPLDDFTAQIASLESRMAELVEATHMVSDIRAMEHQEAMEERVSQRGAIESQAEAQTMTARTGNII